MNHQFNDTAQQFFLRIQEAARQDRPVDAVRDFRVVLEAVFRDLTKGDPRSFTNLFGRIEYVFDMMQVKPDIREQVHSLRILANKVSHDHQPVDTGQYLLALRSICETVSYFYSVSIPEDMQERYASLGAKRFVRPRFRPSPQETVPMVKAYIVDVGLTIIEKSGKQSCELTCREETLGEFKVKLWTTGENDFSDQYPDFNAKDTVLFRNLRRMEGQDARFTSTAETQVVLEPDLLLDISELAECFSNKGSYPLNALLKKLLPQTGSDKAFQGTLVNALLDEAIRTEAPDFITTFRKTVAEKVFQSAAYGREKLNEIYTNIKSHHWANVLKASDDFRPATVRIEPSFFSATYGLQGRLDLMVENAQDPHRKDIVELKSGSPPQFGLWRNNEMQVVGYNMLLKSTFGEERRGNSAILYSRSPENPLRNVVSNLDMENRLLWVRNSFVRRLLCLAWGDVQQLSAIGLEVARDLPQYQQADYQRFEAAWSQVPIDKKAYYRAFLPFVMREYLNAKCGMFSAPEREDDGDGFAALWQQGEEEKALHFNILRHLRFEAMDTGDDGEDARENLFRFRIDGEPQNHNFRAGDTVLVYPRTTEGLRPLRQQVVKARLDEIRPNYLVLSLNNRQLDSSYFQRHGDWVIEHDVYEGNTWQQTQGLFHIISPGGDRLFRLISGQREPQQASLPDIDKNGLNDHQQEILRKALAAEDYFLVQGPPGTGKTSTFLTALVREQLKQPGTIVIVAFTNRAVEEIGERLDKKGIEHLRLGGKHLDSERKLREMVERSDVDGARAHIRAQRVFLSTVATMTQRMEGLQMLKDDLHTLIVDEASQLTEPQLLPLLAAFRRFILIGDQNQLPPVVAQDERYLAVDDPALQDMRLTDLRFSLFERLMRICQERQWLHAWGMLRTHFRMHADIAALVNPWYGGQLECGLEEQQRPWVFEGPEDSPWYAVLKSSRTIFIPSPKEMTPKYHRTEAERVVSLLRYLKRVYGERFSRDTVGVITPWRTQVGLIRQMIGNDDELQALNIDTVERFQGSENDIIIVSFAVYHPAQMELLRSPGKFGLAVGEQGMKEIDVDRKLLVTLSRAREQIVVMGDEGVVNTQMKYDVFLRFFWQNLFSSVLD